MQSKIAKASLEFQKNPYSTQAEMDLMHYHHVQLSNDAATAFEQVKGNKDMKYDRYNLTGSGWYNGAIYPDGSILMLVATPFSGLKLLALTQEDIDNFSGFTPEMMRQINATSSPFSY